MPEKFILMRLIVVSAIKWNRYLQRQLNPFNITLKQQFILRQLEKREFFYPSEIAEMLYSDRPTITVIINNMEKKGWLKRIQDPDNLKMKRIIITPKGKAQNKKLYKNKDLFDEFDPLTCFNKTEIKTLTKLLTKLERHIEKNIG